MKVGNTRCQCADCKEYFNSVAAFDKHRTGKWEARRCMSVDEMESKGMAKNNDGYWVTALRRYMKFDGDAA